MNNIDVVNRSAIQWPKEGNWAGQSHWREVVTSDSHGNQHSCWEDTSDVSIDAQGRRYTKLYLSPGCGDSQAVSLNILIATLAHTIGTLLYNTARAVAIVVIAIFQIVHIPYSWLFSRENPGLLALVTRRFSVITTQFAFSIKNIIRTPYYATFVVLGTLYSFFDSLNGRKMISQFEREWNHGLSVDFSMTAGNGVQQNFQFEGGFDLDHLGKHAYFVAGCCQPFGKFIYEPSDHLNVDKDQMPLPRTILFKAEEKPLTLVSTHYWDRSWNFLPVGCKF